MGSMSSALIARSISILLLYIAISIAILNLYRNYDISIAIYDIIISIAALLYTRHAIIKPCMSNVCFNSALPQG